MVYAVTRKVSSELRAMVPSDMSDDELDADFGNVMDEISQTSNTGQLVQLARRAGELWTEMTRRDETQISGGNSRKGEL